MTPDLIRGRKYDIPLPSLLAGTDTAAEWLGTRRKEIISLLENTMFGAIPPRPEETIYSVERETSGVSGGIGIRREVKIIMRNHGQEHTAHALWYLPSGSKGKIPLITGLNFCGNAGCTDEDDIPPAEGEVRGSQSGRWQIPFLLKNGFSLITAPRNDFFPDGCTGRAQSIFRLFYPENELTENSRGLTAISAWAWGCSHLLELGETDSKIDARSIWLHGHSRLGKTALWCAANDPRFAGVIANDSGCCGDSLFRGRLPEAEHISNITTSFPYWFKKELDGYSGREDAMPFDQHFLAALAAPRPLLLGTASEDVWADPFNSFRSVKNVSPVYRLFGAEGLPDDAVFPPPEQPVFGERLGFYLRSGPHDVTADDWRFAIDFINRCQKR